MNMNCRLVAIHTVQLNCSALPAILLMIDFCDFLH